MNTARKLLSRSILFSLTPAHFRQLFAVFSSSNKHLEFYLRVEMAAAGTVKKQMQSPFLPVRL